MEYLPFGELLVDEHLNSYNSPFKFNGKGLSSKTFNYTPRYQGVSLFESVSVHDNSLNSLRPTWGYKLFSKDGTFLKNGITSRLIPETRYTRSFISDKYMEAIPFPNRLDAYKWEFGQNQILRGPLTLICINYE